MLIPYTVDVPMERYPVANWVLIGVTIISSVTLFFCEQPQPIPAIFADLPPELRSSLEPDQPGWYTLVLQRNDFALHQLVTAALVHAGPVHLLGNMLFLFCFGNAVNSKLGHLAYLAAYMLFAILGNLAWVAFGGGTAVVGASGAIMGVIGVFLVYFPRNNVFVFYFFFFFSVVRYGSFALSSYWLILAYIAFDIWGAARAEAGRVAYMCHLGGALAGIVLATILLRTRLVDSTDTEQNLLQLLGFQR